jgi:hypothetical protein
MRVACGRVGRAGLCSIWAALRNGLQMRAQPLHDNRPKMVNCLPQDNGAVQAATYPRTFCPRTFTVGARRSSTRSPCQDCHLFLAVRLALGLGFCPRAALTHVPSPVTPDLVRLVA